MVVFVGQGEQIVLINAVDAKARGIQDGTGTGFNDRGAYEGVATISGDVSAGLIVRRQCEPCKA